MPLDMSAIGIGSGLNLGDMLDQIEKAERQKLEPLKQQQKSYESKLSGYGKLQSAFDSFQDAASVFQKPGFGETSIFDSIKAQSASDAFSVTTEDDAAPGRYNIQVDQLAQGQSLVADGQVALDQAIGQGGTITLTLGEGAEQQSVDVTLDGEHTSLSDIRNAINNADIGINASIINDGSDQPYRLVLNSADTGTQSQMGISVAGNTDLANILSYDSQASTGALTQTQAAQDAKVTINGIEVISQNNTLEDVIQGLTIDLNSTTTAPESLDVSEDREAIRDAIESFVDKFNDFHSKADKLTQFVEAGSDANGVLLGDSTVMRLESGIRSALNSPVESSPDYPTLIQMGISLNLDGELEIDDDKLDAALENDLDGVKEFFVGNENSDGFASSLSDTLDRLSDGVLDVAKEGMQGRVDRMDDRMDRTQERIDHTVERYRQQFLQLDKVMSSLNATQSYLTTQLAGLANMGKQNS